MGNADNFALDWIKEELESTLDQARAALESYAEDGREETRLRSCLTSLHQVHGTMRMLELDGVALMAEHMEQAAQSLLNGSIKDAPSAERVLMQSLLQLPNYLEEVQNGLADDMPLVIGDVNELRECCGLRALQLAPPVSAEFSESEAKQALKRFAAIDGPAKTSRIRAAFQGVLLKVLKGEVNEKTIATLGKIASGLQKVSAGSPLTTLWRAFEFFAAGYRDNPEKLSKGAIKELRRVDAEIKRLATDGALALIAPLPVELIRDLLRGAEALGQDDEEISVLRSAIQVPQSVDSTPREAMEQAILVLREELSGVRDAFDLYVRAEQQSLAELAELTQPLEQIAGTCGVLGYGSLQRLLQEQRERIGELNSDSQINDDLMLSIASSLVQVDSELEDTSTNASYDQEAEGSLSDAQLAVIQEARAGLEQVKHAIVDSMTADWDASLLEHAPKILSAVQGALTMVPLVRAARMLSQCTDYVEDRLLAGQIPETVEIEAFADSVSGIDYYLERLYHNDSSGHAYVLDEVAQRLATLSEAQAPLSEEPVDLASVDSEEPTAEVVADSQSAPEVVTSNTTDVEETTQQVAQDAADSELTLTEVTDEDSSNSLDIDHSESSPEAVLDLEEVGSRPLPDADDIPFATDDEIDLMSLDFGDEELDGEVIDAERTPASAESSADVDVMLGARPEELGFGDEEPVPNEASDEASSDNSSTPKPAVDEPENVSDRLDLVDYGESDDDAGRRDPTGQNSDSGAAQVDIPEALALASAEIEELEMAAVGASAAVASSAGEEKPAEQDSRNTTTVGDIDIDPEIVEIFVEEVDEVLVAIQEAMPLWSADLSSEEPLGEIRRGFHTLKGSGRIVGANQIGELAWSVENMLNRLLDGTIKANDEHLQLVARVCEQIPDLKTDFAAGQADVRPIVHDLMEGADVLSSGGALSQLLVQPEEVDPAEGRQEEARQEEQAADRTDSEIAAMDLDAIDLDDQESESAEPIDSEDEETAESLFAGEAREHLVVLEEAVKRSFDLDELELEAEFMRGLHTISGSAATVGELTISEVARTLETLCGAVVSERAGKLDGECLEFVREGVASIEQMLSSSTAEMADSGQPADTQEFVEEAQRLIDSLRESTGSPKAMMDAGHADVLIAAPALLQNLLDGTADSEALVELRGALSYLCEAQLQPQLTELAEVLLRTHDSLLVDALDDKQHSVLLAGHERILICLDAVAAEQPSPAVESEVAQLQALSDRLLAQQIVVDNQVAADKQELVAGNETPGGATTINDLDEIDPDLIDIFFEEAEEILEDMDKSLQEWQTDRENSVHLDNLLRGLHTLKGGARLSRLMVLGDMAHDYESELIKIQELTTLVSDEQLTVIQASYDELAQCVNQARYGEIEPDSQIAAPDPVEPIDDVDATAAVESTSTEAGAASTESTAAMDSSDEVPGADRVDVVAPIATEVNTKLDAAEMDDDRSRSGQEMVRVSASLLENLVNIAGESSIVRARVEQGMTDFSGALEEMETTIERVREQLRRLEIETETRMLSRTGSNDSSQYEDFDPLEMDRYSQLEQLTRSLTESATDMLDLKETLRYRAREAETLLMQQARLNTELQEGLMRTRMVPFSRLMPRLRSIVRQVSRELGKEIEFHAYNAEGELDRNVLERMVPPLEHMLRNAIDHGIESSDLRHNFGKPTAGRINLRLMREGGDVVIEISDDGAGIDVESVRVKAAERGLMEAGAPLSDEQVMEFVLAPGFSTAKSLTQISGRGVGMDIVHSEVKQLGGSIAISSVPGQGTSFTVRLPFTVSVNRALMVTLSDDQYAIPLNTIEGIVLLPVEEIDNLQQPDAPAFEYAGIPYRVRYLGNYLGREYVRRTDKATVPIVLVRSGEHAVAVLVDDVQGSREIVVKSLGPQFAGVGGISGATILGDGSVVVILDLLALIRSRGANATTEIPHPLNNSTDEPRWVMVVDDSVTVRKVTSRLLERQGMNVMVAKDGVEAIALLQERRPDIVLLDIEMPRMDGFEVARQVRHDSQLQDLPIVMISSRTGHKHTDRAKELGVNAFLGKPFQENELLEKIDELVTRK